MADGLYYEVISSKELAKRLDLPTSWVRNQTRKAARDPIPHLKFGKYCKFQWLSPALKQWIEKHLQK